MITFFLSQDTVPNATAADVARLQEAEMDKDMLNISPDDRKVCVWEMQNLSTQAGA